MARKRGSYNNPGGMKTSKGVIRFESLEKGYEALNSLLYRRYDHMTLKEMFQIYAPSSDGNKPSKYAEFVRQYLNKNGYQVDYGTVLDFSDPAFRGVFTCAISIQESGRIQGGEEFALAQAKAYDPTKDTRKTYSQTEKRREKRKDRPKQTIKSATKEQSQNKDDGVSVRVAPQKETPHLALNNRLSSVGKHVSDSPQNKPQTQSRER